MCSDAARPVGEAQAPPTRNPIRHPRPTRLQAIARTAPGAPKAHRRGWWCWSSGTGTLLGSLIDAAVGDLSGAGGRRRGGSRLPGHRDRREGVVAGASPSGSPITPPVPSGTPPSPTPPRRTEPDLRHFRWIHENPWTTVSFTVLRTHPQHPSGVAGIRRVRAHGVADALAYGVKVTGCTVHLVDAGYGHWAGVGAGNPVPVLDGDDEQDAARTNQGRGTTVAGGRGGRDRHRRRDGGSDRKATIGRKASTV